MVKIGSIDIDTNIFLAPMSGCSDLSLRRICREHGAGMCFFEMIDSNCIMRKMRQSREMLKTDETDRPIAAQLLGSDPSMMADAASKLFSMVRDISFLDINFACPARKVIRKKAGAYLLKEPDLLSRIIKRVAASVPVPVTVKMRIGYDDRGLAENADVVKICEASGAAAVFLHGRTAVQGYAGDINYEAIRNAKRSVKIPVFGSGNIFGPQSAEKMLAETGCDGILIARGALGNPWIFNDVLRFLKDGILPGDLTYTLRREALVKHLFYIEKFKITSRESARVALMRKTAIWYVKGFPDAARLRNSICYSKSRSEILDLINKN